MKRLAKFVVFLIAVAAAWWFWFQPKRQEVVMSTEVWVGSQESGCMYPVDKIMDGKNPEWWNENRRLWDQFESKKAAAAAGYRECP